MPNMPPKGPKGPQGAPRGPRGPRAPSAPLGGIGPLGPLGLFRSHSEWKASSNGGLLRKETNSEMKAVVKKVIRKYFKMVAKLTNAPLGGWAHGALWAYSESEAIPNGKQFRMAGYYEKKVSFDRSFAREIVACVVRFDDFWLCWLAGLFSGEWWG